MARALIVGCGCRGRGLGAALMADGWLVRGTSRGLDGLSAIEAASIEPALADPDAAGTVFEQVGDVTVVVWALASATGDREALEAIHGPRLERILEKLVDTPVRGFVYEAAGTVDPEILVGGAAAVREAAERWHIPAQFLTAPPDEPDAWVGAARAAVLATLSA